MLEPRFVRRVEITFKSHNPLSPKGVERFMREAVCDRVDAISVDSEYKDVSIFVDDVGPPEDIGK